MNKKNWYWYYRHNLITEWFVIDYVENCIIIYSVKFVDNIPVHVLIKPWFDINKIDYDFLLKQDL